jgi:two-component sensor histidine kinase/tetratricopeptide (TPR) repeat protein
MKLISLLSLVLLLNTSTAQTIEIAFTTLKTDKQKADTLYALGMKHFIKARYDSAGVYFKKAEVVAQKMGNDSLLAKFYLAQCNALILKNDAAGGLQLLQKMRPFITNIPSYHLQQRFLLLNAMGFEGLHKIDSALYYYHKCELLNNKADPYENWRINSHTGFIFFRADDFEKAENYFIKAYEITKAKGIRIDYGIVLYDLGNLYYQWGKTEKFAAIISEQQIFMQSGKKDYSKDPEHRMLFVDWKKEPFEKKLAFMKNVKEQFLSDGSSSNAALANLHLAAFYEENKEYETALEYVLENKRLLEQEKDIIKVYINTKQVYRLLKKAGKISEALAEADKIFVLKDSILKLQQRETMLDIATKYETEKKEKDIILLHSQNELSALKLHRESELLAGERDLKQVLIRENLLKDAVVSREQAYSKLLSKENEWRKTQLVNEQALKVAVSGENLLKGEQLVKEKKVRRQLTAGTALLLLSGLTIFFMYRKQRAKNRLIQKQSDDLQVLMKEIHHRVKNNLQVISSLLDLQSLSIKDKHASDAVREGKIRVQSMALIHQNLYSEGNIKGILMKDYINNLVENLFNSYNIEKDKIRLITDIGQLNLDVDTVIPLGLIINELISNSLKYAFKETAHGEIYVTLKENNKHLELKVKDNGCGFPANWNKIQSKSFGYNLVNAFAQKLKAKLDIYNDNGACISMNISRYKLA